jgi:anti-sigma factor RsiW
MSGMNEHPELQLSAYLDEALLPADRAAVSAHLEGCPSCRARLAELRATSRLIGALPAIAPTRSLVPRLQRAPVWLRPVRLLGAMGSGLFVFLFLASAVINSGSNLGGGATTAEQLAEKGQFGAAVNALASDAAAQKSAPSPAPVFAPAAGQAPQASSRSVTPAAPSAVSRADAATAAVTSVDRSAPRPFGPPPVVFLGLAAFFAIAAIVAHRRLRRG